MKIQRVVQHQLAPAGVYEMACTGPFQEQKCRDAGALSWNVTIARTEDAAVVRTKRKLPTVGFPPVLRKVVPAGVTSTETISWGVAAADGSRTADLHVDFRGAPARMSGTIRLAPDAAGSSLLEIDAEFKALIPAIGGRIEKLAVPIIIGVIEAEEQWGQAWVADGAV